MADTDPYDQALITIRDAIARANRDTLDAMPVARVGYVLCETEDGFTGDCADWNCTGPHYAIHRGREVQP